MIPLPIILNGDGMPSLKISKLNINKTISNDSRNMRNYISIINDDEYIFMLFPENLPARDVLLLESLSYENKSNNR